MRPKRAQPEMISYSVTKFKQAWIQAYMLPSALNFWIINVSVFLHHNVIIIIIITLFIKRFQTKCCTTKGINKIKVIHSNTGKRHNTS